ncbi:MAG: FG-GAP repeat domain-containing protein, partial [Anaerolineae bacterium]
MKTVHYIAIAFCLLAGLLIRGGQPTHAATPPPPALSNLQSPISNLQYPIPNLQSPISNLKSAITSFTLSGTIRDPAGAPAPDVWVGVSSDYEWDETTTDNNGFYSVEVTGPTWLRFYIRPPVESRLAQRVVYKEGPFDSNTTQDFDLVAGYLFAGEVQSSTGDSVYLPWGADITALTNPPPADESFSFWTNWRDGTFQTVLPPDVYSIVVDETPRPYYPTRITVDLRSADLGDYNFVLNTSPDPLPGVEPPDATRISLGTPDADGYLSVSGAPGAVSPFAGVFIAHMTSGRWTTTVAGEDGSFSATAYGPPGSFLIIKQDPSHRYINHFVEYAEPDPTYSHPVGAANLDPLASTTLQVPIAPAQAQGSSEFLKVPSGKELGGTRRNSGGSWPLAGSGIVNPYEGVAMWIVTGEIAVEDTTRRVTGGTLDGVYQPGLYAGGIHWPKPALADLDGDGDLDLFIGDDDGYITYYRNDGLSDFRFQIEDLRLFSPKSAVRKTQDARRKTQGTIRNVNWTFVTDRWENMDISWWTSPAFVDIDHDGDLDLLAGAGNGRITFFRNIGTPTTPAWRFVTDEYAGIDVGSYAAPAFADIDADGDYDLFIGDNAGRVVFYRNIGSREEAVWMFVTDDYLGGSVDGLALPALADVEGDGDLDFFVGSWGGISHWRNDGTPTAPAWTLVSHRYAGIYEPGDLIPLFADLDQDGDLDLLLSWKYGPIRTYTNVGTSNDPLWARTVDDTLPLDLGGYSTPVLADWDADGDLDLLVGDYHSRVHMLRNEGGQWATDGGRWTDVGLVPAVNPDDLYHAAPALVDIDGDGDLDLFVGEDDGTLDFLRNLGSPAEPNWVLAATDYQGFDVGTHAKPTFGDLDGDGDYDLLVGDKDGLLHFYENIGTPTAPAWAPPDDYFGGIDVGRYSAPLLANLDGDLDLDLLIGVENGRIWAYENDSGAWTLLTQAYGAAWPAEHATPALGDLNGDGWPDLVAGSLAGGLQVYLNRGAEPPTDGLQPGDALTASGTLRITSAGLPADFDPATVYLGGSFEPRPLFDVDGQPHGTTDQFYSNFLTPGGFPVERYASWYNRWASYFEMTNKHMVDDPSTGSGQSHTIEADFEVTLYLPDDLPAGWYRPTLELSFGSIPGDVNETVAGIFTSNRPRNLAFGPLLKVGQPATPHLPWMLLADTFSNATRGTTAVEDAGSFQLANRRIFQAGTFFVPRSDPRFGEPYTYRLEPFVPFVSVSDHSLPNAPLIPLAFPSGQLHVTVQKPDGAVDDLGTAPFVQSTSRTPVMLNGDHYESCSGSVGDVYQLITDSGQFDYQFTQYGSHLITMTGTLNDIWGNTYTGGGTYRVVVGREIHIHPGAIPGTPFQVGDALAPALRLSPAVPADVTMRMRLYRNSDPNDVLDRTITGRANRFGYFHPGAGSGFAFDAPGEYRVDVTAIYTDTGGVVWVGSQSWGNVVETPGTRLVAHGRRGIDQSYTRTQ